MGYKETLAVIEDIAAVLLEQGLKPGDRVALTGKNTPQWALAYMGVLFAGGVIVPLDYQLKDNDLSTLIEFAGAEFIFVDHEKYDHFKDGPFKSVFALDSKDPHYILDLKHQWTGEYPKSSEEDLAAILFTSGTTGTPKGVMLTHKNFVSDCLLSQTHMEITHEDVFYALLPLHHSYSMQAVFIEGVSVGAEIVFGGKMVVNQILSDLKEGNVTMFLGIPLLFNKLYKGIMKGIKEKSILAYGVIRFLMAITGFIKRVFGLNLGRKLFKGILAKVSLDTNRICISGGGPLPASTFSGFNALGIDFVQGYGLTETSPILALNPKDSYQFTSVGKVVPQADIRIIDPDSDGRGEIVVRGPMVMKGYYKNEEATKEIFTEDGYLKTGDVGYLDSKEFLYLTGRAKNLIVTEGGKNVFPEEIENAFQLYDQIEQVLVKGYLQNAKTKSEGIEAYFYPSEPLRQEAEGQESDFLQNQFDKIVDHVNRELLPYQRISRFKVLAEPMEMTSTKKIKRFTVS